MIYLWNIQIYLDVNWEQTKMLLTSSNIRPNMFCKIIFLTEAIILPLVDTCPIALQNS